MVSSLYLLFFDTHKNDEKLLYKNHSIIYQLIHTFILKVTKNGSPGFSFRKIKMNNEYRWQDGSFKYFILNCLTKRQPLSEGWDRLLSYLLIMVVSMSYAANIIHKINALQWIICQQNALIFHNFFAWLCVAWSILRNCKVFEF